MPSSVQSRRTIPRLRNSESLAAIVSQAGPLPEEQVWSVIDQLLARLESLHEEGKCHRCISLSTIGIDAAGELEIATSDASLSISDLVRLHAPLPSSLRHEFELVISANANDSAMALAHAGFGGDGVSLDLFQVAVLTIRMVFDVDSEKFLTSPCLQETLSPQLCQMLRRLLAADKQDSSQAKALRGLLPGATIATEELSTPIPRAASEAATTFSTATSDDVPVTAESNSQSAPGVNELEELPNTIVTNELSPNQLFTPLLGDIEKPETDTAENKPVTNVLSPIWIGGFVFFAIVAVGALVVVWLLNR